MMLWGKYSHENKNWVWNPHIIVGVKPPHHCGCETPHHCGCEPPPPPPPPPHHCGCETPPPPSLWVWNPPHHCGCETPPPPSLWVWNPPIIVGVKQPPPPPPPVGVKRPHHCMCETTLVGIDLLWRWGLPWSEVSLYLFNNSPLALPKSHPLPSLISLSPSLASLCPIHFLHS